MSQQPSRPPTRFARNDIETMRGSVLFEGSERHNRLTRFWTLLLLASLIAAAGVVADSTATVIGAMIVAPMMLPIQGTMLSVVLADRVNMLRSIALVVTGAAAAIAVGYLVGLLAANDIVAQTNSQVASRVTPRLIDLLAALGTGAVGSIALVRRDIADTLPGVAIAISLVPPLSVVGLTLESGAPEEAVGALLLFATNVAAILVTGVVIMAVMGVHPEAASTSSPGAGTVNRRNAVLTIGVLVVLVGVPLTINTVRTVTDRTREARVASTTDAWAKPAKWHLVSVATRYGRVVVTAEGPDPAPTLNDLRQRLMRAGVDPRAVTVVLVPTTSVDLGGVPAT